MNFEGLEPVKMICPNCGQHLTGYRSRDQTTGFSCERCGVTMVSKRKTKRIIDIRLTAPPDEQPDF